MENRQDILNELQELSPTLAAIEKLNVFTVPQGYFTQLPDDITIGIGIEYGNRAQVIEPIADDVPTGYFDSLAGSIMVKIKAGEEDAVSEIRALSPMLYSIQNEAIYQVPPGYFENLPGAIVNKVIPQTKVVKMQGRTRAFFKYAVAAAFTGVMALGVFQFTQPADEFVLPEYVTAGLQVENVDMELAKISDADIVKYLEASGTDVNAAMVANSIDKNELPAQEDYLLDDQALDNYLNSINIDDLKN
ncbi:MAG: hypothetical protein WBO30_00195 [Ferruginibacter sp.]